jgi:LysM repeat protein
VLPPNIKTLDAFAQARGLDAAQLRRFNPAFEGGRVVPRKDVALRVLAPVPMDDGVRVALDAPAKPTEGAIPSPVVGEVLAPAPQKRSHTVARGESLSVIAHRYGVRTRELIALNKLDNGAKIRPGMVLRIDAEDTSGATAAGP